MFPRTARWLRDLKRLGCIAILSCPCLSGVAHDSPEHVVDLLTQRMAAGGETSELLLQRAVEYRALENVAAAEQDLQAALHRDAKFLPALSELARLYLEQRKGDSALQTINRALASFSNTEGDAPDLLIIRAQTHFEMGQTRQALEDCGRAFATGNPQLDWYLLRSQIQAAFGEAAVRAKDLAAGWEQTGSSVLKAEWIDALIDAGQVKDALKQIEPELADSRWQSSWLLRRARVHLALGKKRQGRSDLRAAIAEINQRLRPVRPDLTLLADRGTAFALLGDRAAAEHDLKKLRLLRADDWVIRPLLIALRRPGGSAAPSVMKKRI